MERDIRKIFKDPDVTFNHRELYILLRIAAGTKSDLRIMSLKPRSDKVILIHPTNATYEVVYTFPPGPGREAPGL